VIPVKTRGSNFVYRGPTLDIGDIWVERAVTAVGDRAATVVYVDWLPTDPERNAISLGKGLVRLGIIGMEPIPPVSLEVRPDLEIIDVAAPAPDHERL